MSQFGVRQHLDAHASGQIVGIDRQAAVSNALLLGPSRKTIGCDVETSPSLVDRTPTGPEDQSPDAPIGGLPGRGR